MIRLDTFLLLIFTFLSIQLHGQFLLPGEGIMDIKLGADLDEIEWELGFKGNRIDFAQVDPAIKLIAKNAGIDFDFMISYNHIMWLPVSHLLLKNGKVCMVQLSSYPEYNRMICADIGTIDGLNFWDSETEIKDLYGEYQSVENGDETIIIFEKKGLGVEMSENEVRTMFIFEPK
jgi:hypothetical protein